MKISDFFERIQSVDKGVDLSCTEVKVEAIFHFRNAIAHTDSCVPPTVIFVFYFGQFRLIVNNLFKPTLSDKKISAFHIICIY